MNDKLVAFDIGESQVHLVYYANKQVKKAICAPLPDNLVANGEILSMDAMADFLKELAKQNGIPRAAAAVILPDSLVFTRNVSVPLMTESQLAYNLPYEFKDYLTHEKSDYFFDYAVQERVVVEPEEPAYTPEQPGTGQGASQGAFQPFQPAYQQGQGAQGFGQGAAAGTFGQGAAAGTFGQGAAAGTFGTQAAAGTFGTQAAPAAQTTQTAQRAENEQPQAQELKLFACATLKETIAQYRGMFHRAGFKLKIAIPEEAAYAAILRARIESGAQQATSTDTCFVDIGFNAIRMLFYQGDSFYSRRIINLGTKDVVLAIADARNVDAHMAYEYLRSNYEDVVNAPAALDLYQRMAVEIMKAINFYNYNNREQMLERIYLCGGGAGIVPLQTAIDNHIEAHIRSAEELLPEKAQVENPLLFIKALGCALQE